MVFGSTEVTTDKESNNHNHHNHNHHNHHHHNINHDSKNTASMERDSVMENLKTIPTKIYTSGHLKSSHSIHDHHHNHHNHHHHHHHNHNHHNHHESTKSSSKPTTDGGTRKSRARNWTDMEVNLFAAILVHEQHNFAASLENLSGQKISSKEAFLQIKQVFVCF